MCFRPNFVLKLKDQGATTRGHSLPAAESKIWREAQLLEQNQREDRSRRLQMPHRARQETMTPKKETNAARNRRLAAEKRAAAEETKKQKKGGTKEEEVVGEGQTGGGSSGGRGGK